jgi:hypothetical protein
LIVKNMFFTQTNFVCSETEGFQKTLKPEPECVAFQLPVPSAEPAARRKRTQDFDIQLCLFQCPTRSPFGVRRFDRIPSLRT